LQECIKENTSLLNEIKKLLTDNKENDEKLEEKNNEINVSKLIKLLDKNT
jgi:hypothetical protein